MFGSLHIRLTTLCIALAVIPLTVVGALLAWQNYQLQQQHTLDFERQITLRASSQVSDLVTTVVDKLALAIKTADIPHANHDAQEHLLAQIALETNGFDELAILDQSGHEQVRVGRTTVFGSADLRDRSQDEAVAKARDSGRPYFSSIRYSKISNEPLIVVVLPLVDPRTGQITGAVSGDVRLKSAWDVVASIQFGEQGTVAIADEAGHVVAHRNPSVVLRGTMIDDLHTEGIYPGITGGDVARAVTPFSIGNKTFYAVAELPLSEVQAAASQAILTTSVLVFFTLLMAASIGFVAVRRVVRPIRELAATARAISAGDLSRDATVTGRDELGDLSSAFNSMTSQLRSLLSDLEHQVADRTAALEDALSEVQARAVEQERLLAENTAQRETIMGLSVPVLPISRHTLVMPLVGDLDSARLQLVQEQALLALEKTSARSLVLDITGVPVVDTTIAQGLLQVVQAARLLGAEVILVGIRPEVAQSIVGLGIDLQYTRTSSDLQTALGHTVVR